MAELQKLLLANGTDKSELMQAFLAAHQSSFREHSKTGGSFGHSSSSSSSSTSGAKPPISAGSALLSSPSTGAINQPMLQADINLNVSPSLVGSSGGMGTGAVDILNVASPGSSSIQAASPFPDLSTADLSPLPAGININMGAMFDNNRFVNQGGNLNGNSIYANTQGLVDNNMPSPLFLPNVDNLESCSPPNFLMGATDNLASPELSTSPSNFNVNAAFNNSNNMAPAPIPIPIPSHMDSKTNLNINTNLMPGTSPVSSTTAGTMLSPATIKQEPLTDTTSYEQEQGNTSSDCFPLTEMPAIYDNLSDVSRVLSEVKSTPNHDRLLLLNQVTDMVVEAHLATTINTYDNVAAAKRRIDGNSNADIHDMPDISKLSLSASDLWRQFLMSLVPEITKVVKFSKKLPGFSDVTQDDQIKLIKQGTFEVMVARYTVLVDEKNELMLDPQLKMLSPRHVISEMPMGPFLDEFFNIAKQFNPLKLTDGEIGLFTSILMMNPDRDGLEKKNSIKMIQDLFLQALYFLMKMNHEDVDRTFCDLIHTVPVFRKVNGDHAKFLNNIKMKSPSDFEKSFPPLHKEVFVNETD